MAWRRKTDNGERRNELACGKRRKCLGLAQAPVDLAFLKGRCGASSTLYALRPLAAGPVEPVER